MVPLPAMPRVAPDEQKGVPMGRGRREKGEAMREMLHERLREWSENIFPAEMARTHYGEDDGRVNSMGRVFGKMADEIVRCYHPKPVDCSGEPWELDDDCITDDGEEAVVVGYRFGNGVLIYQKGIAEFVCCEASDLKRQAPKVLDAYGEVICKGDTVWDVNSGEKLTVQEFANIECGLVQCCDEDGDCEDYDAHNLTHREPDSLEKLRDDMEKYIGKGLFDPEKQYSIALNRLTALIERGA